MEKTGISDFCSPTQKTQLLIRFVPLSKVLLVTPGELSSIHGKVAHIAPGVALIVQFI